MWTTSRFPAAMRSLNPTTRLKAIEIANQLLEKEHVDKQRVIAISIDEARQWARCGRMESDVLLNQMRSFL